MSSTAGNGIHATSASEHKVIVHHLENSRSQRILWLLEELGVPYEVKKYKRTPDYRAPPELKEINPLGTSPIIQIGDIKLAESGAIVDYLITKYGQKLKPTDEGYLDDLYFSHYAEGSLMPILVNKLLFRMIPNRTPVYIRPLAKSIFSGATRALIEPQLQTHRAFIEDHLKKSKSGWFAGRENPTSADYQMFFAVEALRVRMSNPGEVIENYSKRVKERPAFKRALERGGEFLVASAK